MSKMTIIFIIVAVIVLITAIGVIAIIIKNKKETEIIEDTSDNIKADDADKKSIDTLIDYNVYEMTMAEKIKWSLIGMAVVFACSYVFYDSVLWSLAASSIGLLYPRIKKKDIIKTRKQKLLLQFKEALYIISSSLSAGKSVENAFIDAYNDLKTIFDYGKEGYILNELIYINRRIKLNQTIEDALNDFAKRSGLEDVTTFANVFCSCKSTGGNLKEVTEITSNIIGEKIGIEQDIETQISGKKFEANILVLIPFIIIIFIRISAPSFIMALYNLAGRLVSTFALLLILLSRLWSNKIINIEV